MPLVMTAEDLGDPVNGREVYTGTDMSNMSALIGF
jgi:hypothetical protein